MLDILRQIEKLQNDSQKFRILMTDIELLKKISVDTIAFIENGPYSYGKMNKNC